ncbi:MAG: hypothetical protein P4L46_05295 [Fimbriimonas sp.]|nr:hypothetical protein [Fimbriimonas sp.]
MKSIRPEDRTKAIGLVVGVVVVFALVVMRVKSALGGDMVPPPTNATVQVAGTGSTSGPAGTTPVPEASAGSNDNKVAMSGIGTPKKDTAIKLNSIATPPTKDPFKPHLGIGMKSDDEVAIEEARKKRAKAMSSSDSVESSELPTPISGTLPPTERTGNPSNKPVNPEGGSVVAESDQPKADSLLLSGIVSGPHPIVVIKLAGKDYIVSTGDRFANGFTLVSATDSIVVVSQGMVYHTLKFGVPID